MIYDACAILAVAFGEPNGVKVKQILDKDRAPAMSAINLGEILVTIERRTGKWAEEEAWPKIEPVTEAIAREAAGLFLSARAICPKISLADSVAVATAMKAGTEVVTTHADYRAFDPRWVEIVN